MWTCSPALQVYAELHDLTGLNRFTFQDPGPPFSAAYNLGFDWKHWYTIQIIIAYIPIIYSR